MLGGGGGCVSHPSQLITGLVIKSVTTSPTLAGERMLFILQVSILSEQTYFQEIIRMHVSVETHTYHQNNSPYGTLMDGWRKTEDRLVKSQSRVILECYVLASRPGLDQGLCRQNRAQVEGVEGPMGNVPKEVARKGGMPAQRTHLQHLVDSEVLKKKRRSDTACLTSSRGRSRLLSTRKLVSTRYRLPEPEEDSGLRYLLLATPCGDKQPLTTRTMCSSAVKVTPDRRTGHNNLPL